ncbi:Erv41 protein [Saccharomycopsis crataegensis]|uniref:Endoplasmic reticulum-Golgi intermediate compartment protein n=1 Tax=Saccharomycopsis crataegensis TaxID=43959 RepID=A0AAV5QGC0_9ASCO|nr:Erv41 protein [Saccharomycopsis crataegensis]
MEERRSKSPGGIKVFDAFPKVATQHSVRSSRGGSSTIFLMIFVLFIAYVEIGDWFDGTMDRNFTVDNNGDDSLNINIDIVVAMPCNFLHTNVLDFTRDRTLAADYLSYEGVNFFIPSIYLLNDQRHVVTPDMDEIMKESLLAEFRIGISDPNSGAPACHIFGNIPVTKVSGDFHITAKGYTYRDFRSNVPPQALNFSHVISEFSFGDFYPFLQNPLDFTARTTNANIQNYQYFLSAVPTLYKRLGVEIDTYQYASTEEEKSFDNPGLGMPGIFFKYDFEAIKLIVEDKRISFTAFVVRLVTICGGLIICFGWAYRGFDKLIILLFGKKVARRGQEKAATFLAT